VTDSASATLLSTDLLRARYNLACGYANKALEGETVDRSALHEAEAEAYRLLAQVIAIRYTTEDNADAPLVALTRELTGPGIALLAGIWAVWTSVRDVMLPPAPSPLPSTDKLTPDALELRNLLHDHDPGDYAKLFARLGDHPELGSPRIAYPVACYYANIPQSDTTAVFVALAIAIVDPVVRNWAPYDPWLRRTRQAHADDWQRLFASAEPTTTKQAPPPASERILDFIRRLLEE